MSYCPNRPFNSFPLTSYHYLCCCKSSTWPSIKFPTQDTGKGRVRIPLRSNVMRRMLPTRPSIIRRDGPDLATTFPTGQRSGFRGTGTQNHFLSLVSFSQPAASGKWGSENKGRFSSRIA